MRLTIAMDTMIGLSIACQCLRILIMACLSSMPAGYGTNCHVVTISKLLPYLAACTYTLAATATWYLQLNANFGMTIKCLNTFPFPVEGQNHCTDTECFTECKFL